MNKKFSKIVIESGILLLIFIAIFIIAFVFFGKNDTLSIKKQEDKKTIVTKEIAIKKEIVDYITKNTKPNDINGTCFVSIENYGFDEKENNTLYVQYYVNCYKLGDKKIMRLNGFTEPAKVIMKKNKEGYEVFKIVKKDYKKKNTFPKKVLKRIKNAKEDGTIKTLKDATDKKAKDYYGDLNIK